MSHLAYADAETDRIEKALTHSRVLGDRGAALGTVVHTAHTRTSCSLWTRTLRQSVHERGPPFPPHPHESPLFEEIGLLLSGTGDALLLLCGVCDGASTVRLPPPLLLLVAAADAGVISSARELRCGGALGAHQMCACFR